MLEGGFIVLQRKILSWDWYKDSNTKAVFLHLLLTANYEPGEWRGVKIKAGQRITSISKLSNELDLSFKEIRTALKHLQKTGEVACESTSQYTVITIKNYERYQKAASATASNAASGKANKYRGKQTFEKQASRKAIEAANGKSLEYVETEGFNCYYSKDSANKSAINKAINGQAYGQQRNNTTKQQYKKKINKRKSGAPASPLCGGEPSRRVPDAFKERFGDDYEAYEEWANQ